MRDSLGKLLEIEDEVVFTKYEGSELLKGVVSGFTNLKIKIRWIRFTGNIPYEVYKFPHQVVKVEFL